MITKLFKAQGTLQVCGLVSACALAITALTAQTPAPRIRSEITSGEMTPLAGSQNPLAQTRFDAGRVPADVRLNGMTIFFNRSAQQEADLQALIQAQQNPTSPQYHKWLTPDEFAARFGMAQSDIEKVQTWLQQQGFAIDSVNRSHNAIHFSGSTGQAELAFSTEIHYYNVGGKKHFAPSEALSVPTAIAPVVTAIRNLDDFRPKPMHIHGRSVSAKPQYTYCSDQSCSTANQVVLFAPGDIKTTYDINPLINAGDTGSGQTIAIMGQSAIETSDITNFQDAAGLTEKAPTMTLVPNTGTSTVEADGDEGESDLDVEWSGAIATGASINFVYTGNNSNSGVFDSYSYAVDEQIGNIISMSYGDCETDLGQSGWSAMEAVGEQASAQGQTVIAASGDSGSTACYGYTNLTTAQQDALTVNYPASSAYVTGVGGTGISATDDAVGTYWTSAASSSTGILLNSATQWIPEIAWNDNSLSAVSGCNSNGTFDCLNASGGGISSFTSQPSWQTSYFTATGESNPSSNHRLVPDVALYASPNYPGYLYCSSDQTDWGQGQEGSCGNSEFYDPTSEEFTVAGGTSFAAPIFAGEVAILNQVKGYTTGQGEINSTLYSLASNSSTYAAAFHDVTSGNNQCTEGSAYCPSNGGYSAGTGYDMVTGLGSMDLNALATPWPASTSTAVGTTTTVTAANSSPTVGTGDTITVTVSANSGTAAPDGTVNVSIDGGTSTSYTLTTSGSAASASFSYTFTTAGSHSISATYEPTDSADFGSSTGTLTVTAQGTSSGKGSFAMGMTPSTLTVSQGTQGNESLTVTPSGGYTGTVNLTYTTSNDSALANLCVFSGTNLNSNGSITVSSSAAATGTITFDTNAADCVNTTGAAVGRGLHLVPHAGVSGKASNNVPKKGNPIPAGVAFAGLLVAGFLGRSSRKLRQLACVIALASLGLVLTACGSSVSGSTVSNPAKGTYTITFSGVDSTNSAITAQSSFSLVID